MAVADINRDSGAQVFPGQVAEEFDIAVHEALLTDLPEGTIRFLGTAAEGSSGLLRARQLGRTCDPGSGREKPPVADHLEHS